MFCELPIHTYIHIYIYIYLNITIYQCPMYIDIYTYFLICDCSNISCLVKTESMLIEYGANITIFRVEPFQNSIEHVTFSIETKCSNQNFNTNFEIEHFIIGKFG